MHTALAVEPSLDPTSAASVTYADLSQAAQRAVKQQLTVVAANDAQAPLFADGQASVQSDVQRVSDPSKWSETARLHLHFVLLKELQKLRYDDTPLAEYIHLVQWVSSDKEDVPFSFHRCILVAKLFPSLMRGDEFEGLMGLDVTTAAEQIRVALRPFIRRKLQRLPHWARDLVTANPDYVVERLSKNDQWLNEQIRRIEHGNNAQLF